MPTEAVAKALIYAALLLAIGAASTRLLLLPRVAALDCGERTRLEHALAVLLRQAAMVLVAALVLRLMLHTAAAFGAAAMFDGGRLRLVAFDSRWGGSWRVQLFAGGVLLACAIGAAFGRRVGWIAAAVAALAASAAQPLVGHAAGSDARLALHAAHIVGAGLWLGTLGTLVIVPGPAEDRGALLRAFSPVALTGAAILVPTGVAAAWIYLGSPGALLASPYGRMLAVKLALAGVTMACGYWNWQRFRRERTISAARARWMDIVPLALLEASLAAAIAVVTSVLTETAHP